MNLHRGRFKVRVRRRGRWLVRGLLSYRGVPLFWDRKL